MIEAIRQGFPIRVGRVGRSCPSSSLAGEGRGRLCLAVRSDLGAWSGRPSGLSGKPHPCNDEFETGGHLGDIG